jgi:hypothetical protein
LQLQRGEGEGRGRGEREDREGKHRPGVIISGQLHGRGHNNSVAGSGEAVEVASEEGRGWGSGEEGRGRGERKRGEERRARED